MALQDQLGQQIKAAMLAKDADRLSALRMLKSAAGYLQIEKKVDALPDPDTSPLPRISIAEAIKIAQMAAAKAQREAPPNPFAEQAARMGSSEVDAVRERLLKKFKRLGERHRSEKLEQGWTLDEEQDAIIPPGWVKAPD